MEAKLHFIAAQLKRKALAIMPGPLKLLGISVYFVSELQLTGRYFVSPELIINYDPDSPSAMQPPSDRRSSDPDSLIE